MISTIGSSSSSDSSSNSLWAFSRVVIRQSLAAGTEGLAQSGSTPPNPSFDMIPLADQLFDEHLAELEKE